MIMEHKIKEKDAVATDTKSIVIGCVDQVGDLIRIMAIESEITVGSYFSMYFAKSRKAWVVHYGQTRKVEAGNLCDALNLALEKLIETRHTSNGHQFSLYK